MDQYLRVEKNYSVFPGEIPPSASLKIKWLAQRTQVRFRRHIIFALLREKFLGEKSGLFHTYSIEDVLLNHWVRNITQDQQGYIRIATAAGINILQLL